MGDNSPGFVVGILAILKSGNCFVPLNLIFPNERIRFILNDCNIEVLLADKANYENPMQTVGDLMKLVDIERFKYHGDEGPDYFAQH